MKQNDKKSLCQRFWRWNCFHDEDVYRVLAILFFVLCIIICVTIQNKYEYEFESYDEADYKYLTAIVYSIWDEEAKSLKLDYIPDNVDITEANISPSGTNFKCLLRGKTDLIPAPFVNVHISEDFNVEVSHYTESEFRSSAKLEFGMFCAACCILCLFAEIAIWWSIKILIYFFCNLYDLTEEFVINLNKS